MPDTTTATLAAHDETGMLPVTPIDPVHVADLVGDILHRHLRALRAAAKRAVESPAAMASFVVQRNRDLIVRLLAAGERPENLARLLVEDMPEIALDAQRLLAVIRRVAAHRTTASRHAAPAPTATPHPTAPNAPSAPIPDGTTAATASAAATLPASSAPPATITGAQAIPARPVGMVTPTAGPALTDVQQVRYRTELPFWVAGRRYRHLDCLARQPDESESDYCWRMWHTEPPWSADFPRWPQDSDTAFIRRCWINGSPEEREARRQSLPPTAR